MHLKQALLLVFAFISVSAYAQKSEMVIDIPFNEETKRYGYQEVVEVPGTAKAVLHGRAENWMKQNLKKTDFLINDTLEGKLFDRATFAYTATLRLAYGMEQVMPYTMIYDLTIELKDNKYRYELTNFKNSMSAEGTTQEEALEAIVEAGEKAGLGKKRVFEFYNEIFKAVRDNTSATITGLKEAMEGKSAKKDW